MGAAVFPLHYLGRTDALMSLCKLIATPGTSLRFAPNSKQIILSALWVEIRISHSPQSASMPSIMYGVVVCTRNIPHGFNPQLARAPSVANCIISKVDNCSLGPSDFPLRQFGAGSDRTCMPVICADLREGVNVNFSGSVDSMQYLRFLN